MRTKTSLVILSLFLTIGLMANVTAGEGDWMDMENCGMCKHLGANLEMLEHMTWNHYDVKNGIMSVCTVEDDYAEAYATASKLMGETGAKMMAGEEVSLCGMCTEMSGMMMAGANMELVTTGFGNIRLVTSNDEAMVTKLHAWAEKSSAETAKMNAPTEKE